MKNTTHRVSRFKRGSSTYICRLCNKRTRDTGEGERDLELCARCYVKAGDENAVSDGQMTEVDFQATYGVPSCWAK